MRAPAVLVGLPCTGNVPAGQFRRVLPGYTRHLPTGAWIRQVNAASGGLSGLAVPARGLGGGGLTEYRVTMTEVPGLLACP
jgi:hypothetical protein